MTKRLYAGVLFLFAVATMGCMTESECMSKYNLIKKGVSPTPGPIIIIKKIVGDTLEWKADGAVQTTGTTSIWTTGKIRSDFVGTSLMDFSVHSVSGTNFTNVSYVVFATQYGGDTYTIEMFRVAGDKVRWYMSKNGMNRKVLVSDTSVSKTEVPPEFTAPLVTVPYSFRDEMDDTDIDEVTQFRVGI